MPCGIIGGIRVERLYFCAAGNTCTRKATGKEMTTFAKYLSDKFTDAQRHLFFVLIAALCVLMVGFAGNAQEAGAPLEINEGDSIVFIGNTLAERLSLFGYFETALHSKYPAHRLRVRNMGWSADEVALRPRPKDFGDIHRWLGAQKADLIFAFYGLNESFKGEVGVKSFQRDLEALIEDLRSHQYNGESAPRIVLFSPIAFENLGGDHSDGAAQNENLALYMRAMSVTTEGLGVRFVDLFSPTRSLMNATAVTRLTINGLHLSAHGDWAVSQIMAYALGVINPFAGREAVANPTAKALRRGIYDKNYSFTFHWRAPNMEYIHGERNHIPGAEGMAEELAQLNEIIDQLDEKIWSMPKPKPEMVWQDVPSGTPMWVDTPDYANIEVPALGAVQVMPDHRVEQEGEGVMLSPEEALAAIEVPEGYAINLYASEVDFPIANPVALNFDAEGRLWVANSPTWPHPLPGEQPTDSVIILEDTDGDGAADKHTVFMGALNMVHGFALGDGGAYISQTPNIIHAKDTDGDLRADEFETVLHGFGGEDVEHSINNYKWSPGGALYFMQGIFFHSQIETPYGPRRVQGGGVFRYKPRTEEFDVFVSYRFSNPWGLVFDRWGQGIILDASRHDYYNMEALSANFVYPKDKENKAELLSFAPEDLSPAAGITVIRSHQFPPEAQGRFMANEISGPFRGTRWYDMSEEGTGYVLTRLTPEFFVSKDPFFRPIAMTFGPDGALYFVDFYSTLFENMMHPKRAEGRDHTRGRVWRVSYPDRPLLKAPKIVGEPTPVLLALLKAYENTTRHFARRALQEREASEVVPHLETWIAGLDASDAKYEQYLLEAFWIYQGLNVIEPALLLRLAQAKDAHARAEVARLLRFEQDSIEGSLALLEVLVQDPDPRVRMQAVLASGFSASGAGANVALKATLNPMDAGLKHVLDETMTYFERAYSRGE